eukprot:1823828-Amphidinium_carterae.1
MLEIGGRSTRQGVCSWPQSPQRLSEEGYRGLITVSICCRAWGDHSVRSLAASRRLAMGGCGSLQHKVQGDPGKLFYMAKALVHLQ